MIITIKGADFSTKNIGTLSTWAILTILGEGSSYSGNKLIDKDSSLSATITIADGYELGSAGVSVIMGATDVTSSASTVNGNTITISIATVTGNVTIKVPTLNTATGEEDGEDEEETPTNGQWLSVLLTGDENAHENLMNRDLTGASSLAIGRDVIYTETNVQALLEGKKIYKIASNGLNANTVTLYSNPWKGDNSTNTTDGRTAIGTVTSTSAQAPGTILEYSVSNPSAIKDNETLSAGWTNNASGIPVTAGYNTKIYYLTQIGGTAFASAIASFCSFDFFIGD